MNPFDALNRLGERKIHRLEALTAFVVFVCRLLRFAPMLVRRPMLAVRALYQAGVLSLAIIVVSAGFIGMVLALQAFVNMSHFGAEQSTSMLVALALMRELGSVVSALLFAGRAGSAITAEIGLMNATEQLSAMEIMGVEPLAQIGVPRFFGAFLALPLLTLVFVAVAMLGAYFVGVAHLGLDSGGFWSQLQHGVGFYENVFLGVIVKSAVFGFLCAAISVFQGFVCVPTAQGIAQATTRTVVISSLAVLGADFLLTSVMFGM